MESLVILGFAGALSAWIAWRDWTTRLVDDRESGGLLALALLAAFLSGGADALSRAAIGAGALFGLLLAVRLIVGRLRRTEALGSGDVGLGLACGALAGWPGIPLFLILSGLVGMATALLWRWIEEGDEEAPFAPAMLAAALLVAAGHAVGLPVGLASAEESAALWSWLGLL
jgi:prepilin signal peptidase PulO-like enzyme (type II secretory pathway)